MGGVLWLILYLALGVILACLVADGEERALKKLWLGGVMGIMLLMWSHVPFSFFLGFNVLSHVLGLVLTVGLVVGVFFLKGRKMPVFCGKYEKIKIKDKKKLFIDGLWPLTTSEKVMLICTVSLMILVGVLLGNHTIFEVNGAYYTGQCTYGDMNMHLGFVTSIAEQGMFPPTYSIMAGEPLNYPFLCDSVSSSLYIFGSGLRTAYIAPAVVAFACVFMGFWYIAEAILKKVGRTLLAFALFFFNGGFGIFYFLDNLKGEDKTNFTRIFTAFYETPTNYVNEVSEERFSNIRWTNVIADMLLPQRATLFGWMALFAVIYLLYMAVFKEKKSYFLVAGIMGGLMTMIHTHSYFALGMIAICWIVYSCIKERFNKNIIISWLKFGVPALVLSVPQLLFWTFNAVGESFLRVCFNWANSVEGGGTDTWLWFWVKNVGLVFILLPVAFIHASKEKKCMYSGALLIFAVSEFIVFQPNTYDNIKLFFIWYVFTVIIVADLLADIYEKMKGIKGRAILAAVLVIVCTVSGVLTITREVNSGRYDEENDVKNAYQLYSAAYVKSAEFIKENTEPDSVFLCHNNHNNSIASLTGRNIYCGAGTFLYFHGVGYQERQTLLTKMLTDADAFEENREAAGIDYVFIGDYERGNSAYKDKLIESYLDENYETIYNADGIKIYDVRG